MDYKKEAEYWKEEVERIRDEERRAADAAYERRERERKERQQEIREAQCYADSWMEAFGKAIPRLKYEAMGDAEEAAYEPGDKHNYFFTRQVAQHVFAERALIQEMKNVQPRIDRIRERAERLIAALEQQARDNVADAVEKDFPDSWGLVENLRTDDYMALVNW